MTKTKMIQLINKLPYTGIAGDLIFTDWYTYKQENLELLKECQKDIPELNIYDGIRKFRLITKIKNNGIKDKS